MFPRAWVVGVCLILAGFATAVTFQATVAGIADKVGNAAFLFLALASLLSGFVQTAVSLRRTTSPQRWAGWMAWAFGVLIALFALCGILPS